MSRPVQQSVEPKRYTLLIPCEEAKRQLQIRVEEGRKLKEVTIYNEEVLKKAKQDLDKWSDYNKELLRRMVDTDDLASDYEHKPFAWPVAPRSFAERISEYADKFDHYIDRLVSIKDRLELIPESSNSSQLMVLRSDDRVTPPCKVFIVHGHDEEALQSVARFIESLDLKPIILREQPNQGRTVIEKFEDYADVSFAVVLLMPDDVGKGKDESDLKPRARQNVIFELGFFVAKLGRKNVCALHRGNVEILSDYQGVLWESMDGDAWHLKLAKEMKAAGIAIDLNKLA